MVKVDDLLDGEVRAFKGDGRIETKRVLEIGSVRMPLTTLETSLLRASLAHLIEHAADFAPLILRRPSKPPPTESGTCDDARK